MDGSALGSFIFSSIHKRYYYTVCDAALLNTVVTFVRERIVEIYLCSPKTPLTREFSSNNTGVDSTFLSPGDTVPSGWDLESSCTVGGFFV